MRKSRAMSVLVIAALCSAVQAGPQTESDGAELRQRVLDWLEAAKQYEFDGVLEFEKLMSLPPSPVRERQAEAVRRRIVDEASAGPERDGTPRENVLSPETDTDALIATLEDEEDFLRDWASNRVRVLQHWRVICVDPDNIRVEFASSSGTKFGMSSPPIVWVEARNAGEDWTWKGLVELRKPARSPVDFDRGGEIVPQALREMGTLLQNRFVGLGHENLVSVQMVNGRIVARFKYIRGGAAPDESMTFEFEEADGCLRFRSARSQNGERYVSYVYEDFREVGGREFPFRFTLVSGPMHEESVSPEKVRFSIVQSYRIARLQVGLGPSDVHLLEKPVDDGHDKSYEEISAPDYTAFLSAVVDRGNDKPHE